MSDERTQDLVETLQDPFPRPTGFSRLLILRSESAPSMAITTILLLLVAIVLTLLVVIALCWRVRRLAAVLLLPYLAWVCFATALNYQFLQLNPQADGGTPEGAVERVRI